MQEPTAEHYIRPAEQNSAMVQSLKERVKRLPYPWLLRSYYAWYAARKLTRFEYVRRKAGIPLLSSIDLRRYMRSETVFLLGSGPSINHITPQRWQGIARHDSIGLNFWLFHPFVPTFWVAESIAYGGARDEAARRMRDVANRRARDYAGTVKIITDLFERGRQFVLDLSPEFRRNLFTAYNVPMLARTDAEFEAAVKYLAAKGVFRPSTRIRALLKYGLSLSLVLTLALRLRYRRIVLCGFDMGMQEYFYQDPEKFPATADLSLVPRDVPHGAARRFEWMLPQRAVVQHMRRLLLEPAGIELYVENRSSALWPEVPEAPESLFQTTSTAADDRALRSAIQPCNVAP